MTHVTLHHKDLLKGLPKMPVDFVEYALHKGKRQDYAHPVHQHEESCELIYVDYGSMTVTVLEGQVDLGVGEGFIVPARTPHTVSVKGNKPCDYLNLGFRCSFEESISGRPIYFNAKERIILNELKDVCNRGDDESIQILFLKLNELVLRIRQNLSHTPAMANQIVCKDNTFRYQLQLVNRAMDYLRKNYAVPLKPEQIAVEVGVSYSYLRQILRKHTGESLRQHLRTIRLQNAERLLREAAYSVKMVGVACGYRSSPHFCTVFKEEFGMSPTDYTNSLGLPSYLEK